MSDEGFVYLKDFVAWVRLRRIHSKDAWINEETIEYVTKGIERFLEGEKPWIKPRGNKRKTELMWECYYLTQFKEGNNEFMPQHKQQGGAYYFVARKLNISPSAIEKHVTNAKMFVKTEKGKIEFIYWLSKYKGANFVSYIPKK